MADPISLAAIAGLIFAGRALSTKSEPEPVVQVQQVVQTPESLDAVPEFIERDFEPHVPTTPMPWDFIVTCPAGILKVQIKSTTHKSSTNSYTVSTSTGLAHKASMCDTIDVVGCYVIPEDTWWMIPRKQIKALSIKLSVLPQSKSRYKKYQENWSIFYE